MREIEKLEGFESFNEIPMASCLNKTDLESQEKLQDKKQKMKAYSKKIRRRCCWDVKMLGCRGHPAGNPHQLTIWPTGCHQKQKLWLCIFLITMIHHVLFLIGFFSSFLFFRVRSLTRLSLYLSSISALSSSSSEDRPSSLKDSSEYSDSSSS